MNASSRASPPRRRATLPAVTLVVLQFGLAAALVLSTAMPPTGIAAWMLIISGGTLAVWAWLTMGRRLRILPAPDQQATLVDSGPYAWLRHPMYTGLMVFCGGLLLHDPRPWRLLLYLTLLTVLVIKGRYEERLLVRDLPGYAEYRRRTGGCLPWL